MDEEALRQLFFLRIFLKFTYIFIFFCGVLFVLQRFISRDVTNFSLTKFLYFAYIVAVAFVASEFGKIVAFFIVICAPLLLFITKSAGGSGTKNSMLNQIRAELNRCATDFSAHPDNAAALERMAEIYENVGDATNAKKLYEKAMQVFPSERTSGKIKYIRNTPLNRLYTGYCGCPACGCINLLTDYSCAKCKLEFYSNYFLWLYARMQGFFREYSLTTILLLGVLFLPYLFQLGVLSYSSLWGFWSFGILLSGD